MKPARIAHRVAKHMRSTCDRIAGLPALSALKRMMLEERCLAGG